MLSHQNVLMTASSLHQGTLFSFILILVDWSDLFFLLVQNERWRSVDEDVTEERDREEVLPKFEGVGTVVVREPEHRGFLLRIRFLAEGLLNAGLALFHEDVGKSQSREGNRDRQIGKYPELNQLFASIVVDEEVCQEVASDHCSSSSTDLEELIPDLLVLSEEYLSHANRHLRANCGYEPQDRTSVRSLPWVAPVLDLKYPK